MDAEPSRADAVRFIAGMWMRDPVAFVAIALLIIASGGLTGAIPRLAADIVEHAGAEGMIKRTIEAWMMLGAAFLGAELLVFIFQNLLIFRLASLKTAILQDVMKVAGRAPEQWHTSTLQGTTMRRAMEGADGVEAFTRIAFSNFLPITASIAGILIFVSFRWPMLAALGAIATILFWLLGALLHDKYIEPVHTDLGKASVRLGGVLSEAMTCAPIIRAFAREADEQAHASKAAHSWRNIMVTELERWSLLTLAQSLLLFVYLVVAIGYIFLQWRSGLASAGDAMLGVTSYLLITGLLAGSMHIMFYLQGATVRVRPLLGLFGIDLGVAERAGAVVLPLASALPVSFEDVRFGYPGSAALVVDGISFEVAAGEKVALVGATGSGKSTLIKLIQRLYDVEAGSVRVGGQDVRDLQIESLRRAVGIVPQDPVMFHRSILENIAYGRPDATLEEVREAAALARADEFIMRMPEGYRSLVGERGVKLSGGERQRIAIARAFLADPPILVLDEATSSLDAITERLIQEAVEDLLAKRTAIVIAHRLSTIRNVDRILVIDHGRIIEQGSHQTLVQQGGQYAQLLQAQEVT